jgi:hypothetical protein
MGKCIEVEPIHHSIPGQQVGELSNVRRLASSFVSSFATLAAISSDPIGLRVSSRIMYGAEFLRGAARLT